MLIIGSGCTVVFRPIVRTMLRVTCVVRWQVVCSTLNREIKGPFGPIGRFFRKFWSKTHLFGNFLSPLPITFCYNCSFMTTVTSYTNDRSKHYSTSGSDNEHWELGNGEYWVCQWVGEIKKSVVYCNDMAFILRKSYVRARRVWRPHHRALPKTVVCTKLKRQAEIFKMTLFISM